MNTASSPPTELLVVTRSPLAKMFAPTMEGSSKESLMKRLSSGSGLWAGLVAWAVSAWGTFFVIES